MKIIYELSQEEKKWWKNCIQSTRNTIVKNPSYYVDTVTQFYNWVNIASSQVPKLILEIREKAWTLYLEDEAKFHIEIFNILTETRNLPLSILKDILANNRHLYLEELKKMQNTIGEFIGRAMPYIYEVSLSTTNSRRSRAGKTFEKIIAYIMKLYNYPYEEQSSLGSKQSVNLNLSKIVDGIIPSAKAYHNQRTMCCVLTMKTSLRERWQEVVEEIKRTNLPTMYLLTLETGISRNILERLSEVNVILVCFDGKNSNYTNMISYDEFFNVRIPHYLSFWKGRII